MKLLIGRFVGRLFTRQFGCWLVTVSAALLVGLALVSMPQPSAAAAPAHAVTLTPWLIDKATPTPKATTPTPRASATPGGSHAKSSAPPSGGSAWLPEALAVVCLILLVLSLISIPIAVRSTRIDRRIRLDFKPEALPEEEQVARLSQIPPARKEPLTRAQMQAVHASMRGSTDAPQQSTAHLAASRLVDGVPISLPAEAEPLPQLPAPRPPAVTRRLEDSPAASADESQG